MNLLCDGFIARERHSTTKKKVAALCTPYTSNILVQKRLKKKNPIRCNNHQHIKYHCVDSFRRSGVFALYYKFIVHNLATWPLPLDNDLLTTQFVSGENEIKWREKKIIAKYWLKCIRNNGEQMLTQINIHGRD